MRQKLVSVVKKPENTAYYALSVSLPFFSETDFKSWLDGAKNYSAQKPVLIYENFRIVEYLTYGLIGYLGLVHTVFLLTGVALRGLTLKIEALRQKVL